MLTHFLVRLLSIADLPDDEDDWRIRKRAGVAVGWVVVVAPVFVPLQQPGEAIAWVLALALTLFSAVNLAVLARTRAFNPFLLANLAVLSAFVFFSLTVAGGAVAVPSGLVWGFTAAVAGAPIPRADHAEAALAFARSMLAAVADWRTANGLDLQVRVGLASGPVVGGVIGRRRILFDMWGATVNAAARMESSSLPGRIQLAASTRERLDEALACEERTVDVKGLGPMTTYLLADA